MFCVYTYQWYNDLIADYEDVIGPKPTEALGLQYVRYCLTLRAGWTPPIRHLIRSLTSKSPLTNWAGLQPGDMLIVRTGWVRQYNTLNITERALLRVQNWPYVGLEASDRTLRWLWGKKLSLIGADNPAVESISFSANILGDIRNLRQVFIGGWGMSIVEFLYLEELAPALHSRNRWNFFMTIQNLNVVSGIASPPNALAIL
ncbi:hypothetical protein RRF57_000339 [Xylaria bambusicola]|uniref:Uncharacterized protein n=1 Tax=Xylaria bambusicola TaxID=326684 RepID=A0AAN7U9N9_9PEZI